MDNQTYIMPMATFSPKPGAPPARWPKYMDPDIVPPLLNGLHLSQKFYGADDLCLVRVLAVPVTVHTALVAMSDVVAFPTNLNVVVGSTFAALRNNLERLGIPSDGINAGTRYMAVLRNIAVVFHFAQRFHGMGHGSLRDVGGNAKLDARFDKIPAAHQHGMHEVFQSYGLDPLSISGNMSIRDILKTYVESQSGPIVLRDLEL